MQYTVSCIYRSPQTSCEHFIHDLNTYFTKNNTSKGIEILVGYINVNILNYAGLNVVNYITTSASYGFRSYIDSVTRPISGTCLEYFFIKNYLYINPLDIESYVINYDIILQVIKILN